MQDPTRVMRRRVFRTCGGGGRIGETGQAGGQEGWRGKEEQKGLRVVEEVVAVCATTRSLVEER